MKYLLFLSSVFLLACSSAPEAKVIHPDAEKSYPKFDVPEDNAITDARVALGQKLFFDARLSLDNSIACASCHIPEHAFSDTVRLSIGVDGKLGKRNAPSLANVAYAPLLMRDGGVFTLEAQVFVPVHDSLEMNYNLDSVVHRLSDDEEIQDLSKEAYGVELTGYEITRALACYERTLLSFESVYDDYLKGVAKLSPEEEYGLELFSGDKFKCTQCHSGILFTDHQFQVNGLTLRKQDDMGREAITARDEDRWKYKVPSLRNVELTYPYMHDGSIETLEEVVRAYIDSSGTEFSPYNQSIEATDKEIRAIVAFLRTLTDRKFVERHANDSSL